MKIPQVLLKEIFIFFFVIVVTLGFLYDVIYISDMMAEFLSTFESNLEKYSLYNDMNEN